VPYAQLTSLRPGFIVSCPSPGPSACTVCSIHTPDPANCVPRVAGLLREEVRTQKAGEVDKTGRLLATLLTELGRRRISGNGSARWRDLGTPTRPRVQRGLRWQRVSRIADQSHSHQRAPLWSPGPPVGPVRRRASLGTPDGSAWMIVSLTACLPEPRRAPGGPPSGSGRWSRPARACRG